MIDYSLILSLFYPDALWNMNANDYATLDWQSDQPKPTQIQLDALWPQAQYQQQVAAIEQARLVAYEQQSDPVFFKWQRGDATEADWREAVAKVKLENPYPPAP